MLGKSSTAPPQAGTCSFASPPPLACRHSRAVPLQGGGRRRRSRGCLCNPHARPGLRAPPAQHGRTPRITSASNPATGGTGIVTVVNDHHGHSTGDLLLRRVAELLARSVRPGDVCGGQGGCAGSALLPHASPGRCVGRVQRSRVLPPTCPRHAATGRGPRITVSIGAAWSVSANPSRKL